MPTKLLLTDSARSFMIWMLSTGRLWIEADDSSIICFNNKFYFLSIFLIFPLNIRPALGWVGLCLKPRMLSQKLIFIIHLIISSQTRWQYYKYIFFLNACAYRIDAFGLLIWSFSSTYPSLYRTISFYLGLHTWWNIL